MKNWKTTLAGLALSAYPIIDSLIQAYNAGYFTDKTGSQLWMGIGFIIFAVLTKDYNMSRSKDVQSIGTPNVPKKD